MQPKRYLLE